MIYALIMESAPRKMSTFLKLGYRYSRQCTCGERCNYVENKSDWCNYGGYTCIGVAQRKILEQQIAAIDKMMASSIMR